MLDLEVKNSSLSSLAEDGLGLVFFELAINYDGKLKVNINILLYNCCCDKWVRYIIAISQLYSYQIAEDSTVVSSTVVIIAALDDINGWYGEEEDQWIPHWCCFNLNEDHKEELHQKIKHL